MPETLLLVVIGNCYGSSRLWEHLLKTKH